jgi:hypothetical protein
MCSWSSKTAHGRGTVRTGATPRHRLPSSCIGPLRTTQPETACFSLGESRQLQISVRASFGPGMARRGRSSRDALWPKPLTMRELALSGCRRRWLGQLNGSGNSLSPRRQSAPSVSPIGQIRTGQHSARWQQKIPDFAARLVSTAGHRGRTAAHRPTACTRRARRWR